ncbi:MAG: RnfH family protein [Burkholderiales bacterium]
MQSDKPLSVKVVYALPRKQTVIGLRVIEGTTAIEAIEQSGILGMFPEIDVQKIGIYGKPIDAKRMLNDGDRVEIYRSLLIDPKQARRERAVKTAAAPSKRRKG